MGNKSTLGSLACILVIVGAINWGLVGLGMLMNSANWNVVSMIFGQWVTVEAVIYVLVGLSGVYMLTMCKGNCKM